MSNIILEDKYKYSFPMYFYSLNVNLRSKLDHQLPILNKNAIEETKHDHFLGLIAITIPEKCLGFTSVHRISTRCYDISEARVCISGAVNILNSTIYIKIL